ncbi:purine-nucleoside phosphorylase [Pseudacidobacterium ailaaui]|jgi:purine-nucleoside phosphorylase|uniref:purine-nucleoside phosphorylase n=1 Tax=Pseudacidobacterium ailaaui TaxID=1382359 RepID=UPI00047A342B|nr:purine-nucleoside phosphorylase [Pseudacidobacterium ailaaui]MDI3256083.1 purine-nucleoside phosphorylase [Bacillota bacterium]
MTSEFEKVSAAADFVRARIRTVPSLAVVLGSGLGPFADKLSGAEVFPYGEIPHFPQSTVPGHSGRMVVGEIHGVPLAVMQGRVHGYEGYSPQEVAFPIRVLGLLGVKALVVTNAAGGIRMDLKQGDLVLISDHINFTQRNPVAGRHEEAFGPRFFDLTEAYSRRLRSLAARTAQDLGISLPEGVYLCVTGPSFETPAEIRAFRALGADLVGMSTVQEVIAARQMSIEVLGISCVTNMAAGIQSEPLSHEEVIETGQRVAQRFTSFLTALLPVLHQESVKA